MKKLLLLLFSLLLSFNSYGAERVNLSCALYETFDWKDSTTSKLHPEKESLVVFPDTKQYIFDNITGNYSLSGNSMVFSHMWTNCKENEFCASYDYSLDITSRVWKQTFNTRKVGEKIFKKGLTHSGECVRVENLF